MAGKEITQEEEILFSSSNFPFHEELARVGISFPLFTETLSHQMKSNVFVPPTEVQREFFFPEEIRSIMMEGMHKVIAGSKGTARPDTIRHLVNDSKAMREYLDLQHQVIGKTGTAEILYKHTIDRESEADMTTHVWFAGASFTPESGLKEPELVVVVFLRFGERGGKEGAPIAMQIIKKWREICAKHGL
jgi:cell division protein FtsI/penicillin-binding protein 2